MSTGLDSLLNETKLDFNRGQLIRFTGRDGKIRSGRYVMASSAEGYIVINMGGQHGRPQVVPIGKILLSTKAKKLIRPEWDKMQEFLDKPLYFCKRCEKQTDNIDSVDGYCDSCLGIA